MKRRNLLVRAMAKVEVGLGLAIVSHRFGDDGRSVVWAAGAGRRTGLLLPGPRVCATLGYGYRRWID